MNPKLFGIMGTVAEIDIKRNAVKLFFDKACEEEKFHDPFMGHICLNQ